VSKNTKWILELVDEVSAPLKEIEREAKLVTDIGGDLGESFDDLTEDIKETGTASEEASTDIGAMFNDLKNGDFTAIQNGFASIKAGIVSMTKAGLAFIATPLGATIAALASVGLIANEFIKYNEAAREMNIITEQITHTTDGLLTQNRLRAKNIEETYGKDFQDSLLVAKNLVQAYDITWEEAFDTMENGFIRGGTANDEFMDSMREYPRLFAKNGFSVQEFQRIVNTGIDLGIYSDKLPDAIKEFSLAINEQTQTSRDALENAFGKKFTDELFKSLTDGSLTAKGALMEISEETDRVGVNTQQAAQLTADLFKGAGEDAGGFLQVMEAMNIALVEQEAVLTPLQEQLKRTADKNLELAEAQSRALESDSYAIAAQRISSFWKDVKIIWYNGVAFVGEMMNATQDYVALTITRWTQMFHELPRLVAMAFEDFKKEALDVIKTFGILADVFEKVFTLDFSGAADSAKEFALTFNKEVADVIVSPTKAIKEAIAIDEFTVNDFKDFQKRRNEGAIAESELEASKLVTGGGKGTDDDGNNDDGTKDPLSLTGNGSGAGKSITMTLNIVQNFYETAMNDVEEIATETVRLINDRLRDAVIQTGS